MFMCVERGKRKVSVGHGVYIVQLFVPTNKYVAKLQI